MEVQVVVEFGIEIQPQAITGACVLDVVERWIGRVSCRSEGAVESQPEVATDADWSDS